MDTCTENMSRGEILKVLSELWHAIGDPENYAFVKWVKGGRVFRIIDLRRFYSELCVDLHEDCTPAYFGYFMIACGFEAIPPQFVDYYHEDFLKYDFARIERIRPKCLILTPEAYLLHLEETSSSKTEFMSRNLFQSLELQEELRYDEIWPDPEGLPESPLTPEEVDFPEDSVFILNTFPYEMLSESNSLQSSSSLCSKSLSEFEENIEHENGKTVDPISIKDLKSSLKLNLVRYISSDSETDLDSKDVPDNKKETNLEQSSPSTPDTVSSPLVSPLGLTKVSSFPFIFDPLDPFNNLHPIDPKARTWSSPLSPSPQSCSTPFQLHEPSTTPCDQLTQLSSTLSDTSICSRPVRPYPPTVLTTDL